MEYPKEYGIDNKCRYGLRAIESCRKCLFETLCRLEKDKEERENEEKEKSEQVLNPNQQ